MRQTLSGLQDLTGFPAIAEAIAKPADFANRQGYRADFLGSAAAQSVPLPTLAAAIKDDVVAMVPDAVGQPRHLLHYTNFSLVLSKARHMAHFTAVNIDGTQLKRFTRGNNWQADSRIPREMQVTDTFYTNSGYDRGHMVRRLDPVWGAEDRAKVAQEDTFHFTNACPQVHRFNDGEWGDLEDYILNNAGVHELRVCVFTGPIFQDDDPVLKGVKLPRQFWKVVTIIRAATMKLSATAYLLTQVNQLTNLEFAFGEFRTYQVPVRQIEAMTNLRFGNLKTFDPKEKRPSLTLQPLNRLEDIEF
jgi:endonuclease G